MFQPVRILLVDDNPYFLEAARDYLNLQDAIEVVDTAIDGEDALSKAHHGNPDVILLDINLPGRSGLDLIPTFREQFPEIKIIMLSMLDDISYRNASLQAGANAFVHKTSMAKNLVTAIRDSINGSSPAGMEQSQPSDYNRSYFAELVENAQDLIYRYELLPSRGFTYVSPSSTTLTGYTPAELYADPDLAIYMIYPKDRPMLENLVLGGEAIHSPLTIRVIRKDGTLAWAELRNVPIFGDDHELISIEGIARDITAQKRAEAALKESEDRYRDLVENSRELICTHDLDGRILSANPAATWALGYDQEQLLEMNIQNILAPEERERYPQYIHQMMRTGAASGLLNIQTAMGERRICEFYNSLRTEGIEVPVVRSMARDVTASIQTEASLQESQERLANVISSAMDAVIIVDHHQDIVLFNPAAEKMFGFTAAEVIGQPLDRLMPERYRHLHRNYVTEFGRTGDTKRSMNNLLSIYGLRANGEEFPIEASISYQISTGQHLYTVILRDITERKRAENALRESETQYRSIFNGVKDAIFVETLDGRILEVNDRACELYGYSRAEFLTKTVSDLVPPGQPIMLANASETSSSVIETFNIKANGERFPIEISGRKHTINGGQEKFLMIIVRDITQRKQVERALIESEAALRKAQMVAHVGSWVWHIPENKLEWSDEMYRLFGIEKESFTGDLADVIVQAIHPDDRSAVEQANLAVIQEKHPEPLEYRVVLPDGQVRTVWGEAGELIVDESGQPVLLSGIVQDITERKRAEVKIKEQLARLTALREIDQAITSSFDVNLSLSILLSHATRLLHVDAATILKINPEMGVLEYKARLGYQTSQYRSESIRIDKSFAGKAVLERKIVHYPYRQDGTERYPLAKFLEEAGYASYHAAPLIIKGKVTGVLEVFCRSAVERDEEWLDFYSTLAGQAAIAMDNAELFSELFRINHELIKAYDATIEGWSRAMDLRDKETEGHTLRVTDLTMDLASRYGIDDNNLVHIRRGALLHDIGKMGVPDHILLKPDKLSPEEWVQMKQHPDLALEMLSTIQFLRPALEIPYSHHEKWDGSGYPRGLKGEQIPLPARLFAVVDVWDALTSDRSYRKAWTRDKALAYIREQAGKHFDPAVVELFLQMMDENDH